jgi:hypothetical protein
MVVFTNRSIGPHAELLVSEQIASEMLRAIIEAARPLATARWEDELVQWLDDHATRSQSFDVGEIAWTPEHFETQRRFVIESIARAATSSSHGVALDRLRRMVEIHPRDAVRVGHLWKRRQSTETTGVSG